MALISLSEVGDDRGIFTADRALGPILHRFFSDAAGGAAISEFLDFEFAFFLAAERHLGITAFIERGVEFFDVGDRDDAAIEAIEGFLIHLAMNLFEDSRDRFFDIEDLGDFFLAIDPTGKDAFAFGEVTGPDFKAKRHTLHLVLGKLPARSLGVIVIDFDADAFGF